MFSTWLVSRARERDGSCGGYGGMDVDNEGQNDGDEGHDVGGGHRWRRGTEWRSAEYERTRAAKRRARNGGLIGGLMAERYEIQRVAKGVIDTETETMRFCGMVHRKGAVELRRRPPIR
ncbi:hypothetical protein B0H16DRAFT_1464283 [Mycena metata]|uniref:Uncharacterized protein n=1 Tax=Mycena metata TaxID=1033252 RepID=A0AAD7N2R7_9AGAR|nr:hypothetical protein B0H16DRAFT_1464283 [Mycena metata]